MGQVNLTITLDEHVYGALARRAAESRRDIKMVVNACLGDWLAVDDEQAFAALFAECADEDRALANAGVADYARLLLAEDEQP